MPIDAYNKKVKNNPVQFDSKRVAAVHKIIILNTKINFFPII